MPFVRFYSTAISVTFASILLALTTEGSSFEIRRGSYDCWIVKCDGSNGSADCKNAQRASRECSKAMADDQRKKNDEEYRRQHQLEIEAISKVQEANREVKEIGK